jgi:predicted nuclease with TOPRIM domain
VLEFTQFAESFLPKTNAEGAKQFAEMYDGTLIAMERGKKGSQEAAAEIREKLKALIGEREPGEEG